MVALGGAHVERFESEVGGIHVERLGGVDVGGSSIITEVESGVIVVI